MNETWKLQELKDEIKERKPNDTETLEIIKSISRYIDIFRLHLEEVRDSFKPLLNHPIQANRETFEFIIGTSKNQNEFYYAKLKSEANIISLIHATRSIFDVFAFLINRTLIKKPLDDYLCKIDTVYDKLEDSNLKKEIGLLLDSYWYKYINGFINISKHRYLIDINFIMSATGDYSGIKVNYFKYRNVIYNSKTQDELLEGVLSVKNKVITCGMLLNHEYLKNNIKES